MNEPIPLIENYAFRPIGKPQLFEHASGTSGMRVSGVFQNYCDKNQNGRIYPRGIWENLFKEGSIFRKRLAERRMVGMIEHPEDGQTRLDAISHVITEVRIASPIEIAESRGDLREGDIIGTYEVLEGTPQGQVLKALIEASIQFGVSSRGNGTVTEQHDGTSLVNEDYDCETWDVVFSPSVERAIPKLVQEAQSNNDISPMIECGKRSQWQILTEEEGKPLSKKKAKQVGGDGQGGGTKHSGTSLKNTKVKIGEQKWEVRVDGKPVYDGPEEGRARGIFASWKLGETASTSLWHNGIPIEEHSPELQQEDDEHVHPQTISPPSPVNNMNKLSEMKSKQAEVIRLVQTDTSNLKPSEKAALFECADTLRREIANVKFEDPGTAPLAESLDGKISTFIQEMDDMAAPPAPESDTPPPPPDVEGDLDDVGEEGEGEETPEEVRATLTTAAEKLRAACPDDEECQELADELELLADKCCPDEEVEGEYDDEDMEYDDMPMETAKKIKRIIRENTKLRSNISKLSVTSAKMLEAHRRLKSSLSEGGEGAANEGEYRKAAKELAEKYNTDMVDLGVRLLQAKNPELFEKVKPRLNEVHTWKQLGEIVQSVKSRIPATKMESGPRRPRRPRQVAEFTTPEKDKVKSKLRENKPVIAEAIHPAVQMRQNAKRRPDNF